MVPDVQRSDYGGLCRESGEIKIAGGCLLSVNYDFNLDRSESEVVVPIKLVLNTLHDVEKHCIPGLTIKNDIL